MEYTGLVIGGDCARGENELARTTCTNFSEAPMKHIA